MRRSRTCAKAVAKLVKIYKVPFGGKARWEIRWKDWAMDARGRPVAVWERKMRSSKKAAELLAGDKEIYLANKHNARFRLSDADAYDAESALELLRKFTGKTLRELAIEEKQRVESSRSLSMASGPDVQAVYAAFIEQSRAQHSERTLQNFQSRVGRFAGDFNLPIARLTATDIRAWLDALKVEARTWNNYRGDLVAFFSYARKQKLLPKEWAELDTISPKPLRDQEIEIWTVEEMETLLARAKDSILPLLLLGAFAGLRTSEVERRIWEHVDMEQRTIDVRKQARTKTRKSRLVPIQDNLWQWLRTLHKESGRVISLANANNALQRLAEDAGMKWKHNALRHSYGSYRVAQTQNVHQVSLEMGNSPQEVHDHYLRMVTPKAAARWFNLFPGATSRELPGLFSVVIIPSSPKAASG